MPVRYACALLLLALPACGSMTDTQHTFLGAESTSIFGETLPGISDLDTVTAEDRAEEKWWDRFYGNGKSGAAGGAAGGAMKGTLITPMADPTVSTSGAD